MRFQKSASIALGFIKIGSVEPEKNNLESQKTWFLNKPKKNWKENKFFNKIFIQIEYISMQF